MFRLLAASPSRLFASVRPDNDVDARAAVADGQATSADRDSPFAELSSLFRRIWWGKSREPPTYDVAVALFLRLLGLVYLIAFVSLWTQIGGLVGDDGLLPTSDFLDAVQRYFASQTPPESPVWNVPTLLWLSPHDGMLHALCAVGTVGSLLLIAGLLPMPILALLWVCYLSLYYVGQVFLGFQWDILLLETGFLAIFLAPWNWRSRFLADPPPSRLALWLAWWLLFRLMLESGAVKLTWNDGILGPNGKPLPNTWESLTALDFHYWTQPLPIWTSWYAAKLPEWFQKLSVLVTFTIELVLPWFIFGPIVLRRIACVGFALLMLVIGLTGNYNFFNLLTFALALTLLDDRAWPQVLRRRVRASRDSAQSTGRHWRNVVLVPFAGLALVLGLAQLKEAIRPAKVRGPSLATKLHVAQFSLVNGYGLFRQMTETRPEIVLEGSDDGTDWKEYAFRWKPGDLARPPGFNTPHQPRLDWQMWFEALKWERIERVAGGVPARAMSPWFRSLITQFLKGNPRVVGLLESTPFPDGPPREIRAVLYHYRFTTAAEREATGDWWHRDQVWASPVWSLPPEEE